MDKKVIAFALAAMFSTGFILQVLTHAGGTPASNSAGNPVENPTVSTGSTESGDVLIELTPTGIVNSVFEVSISVNTHSVDLSQYNLLDITSLKYGNKAVAPVDAPKLKGHHASGILKFPLEHKPDKFEITIREIPLVEERRFSWE